MIELFIETNVGSDDKQVAFYIDAINCDNGWEFSLADFEGCSKQEACQWIAGNQKKLEQKACQAAREDRDESILHLADMAGTI